MGNKPVLLFAVSILVIILSSCGKTTEHAKASEVVIDNNASYFSDFTIEGERVLFYCHLCIENRTDSKVLIQISGDFSDDKKGNLIQEDNLLAYSSTTDSSVFELKPGTNKIDVCFIGTHGTASQKQDRNLPKLTIVCSGTGDAVSQNNG